MLIYSLQRTDTGEAFGHYWDKAIAELEQGNYREQMGVECSIVEAVLDERGKRPAHLVAQQPNRPEDSESGPGWNPWGEPGR